MLNFLFGRREKSLVPQSIYRQIVEQSRQPAFYTDFGFKDEVMGRFDSLSLHVFLLSHRLANGGHKLFPSLNQEVYDCYVEELEVSLREIGIGDTTVPKRKKKMVRSFYALIEELQQPVLERQEEVLRERLNHRFFNDESEEMAKKLATYVIEARNLLEDLEDNAILEGDIKWPQV